MILQGPLHMADSLNEQTIRLLNSDTTKNQVVGVYVYLLEHKSTKIGDMFFVSAGHFLAIEQNARWALRPCRRVYEMQNPRRHESHGSPGFGARAINS